MAPEVSQYVLCYSLSTSGDHHAVLLMGLFYRPVYCSVKKMYFVFFCLLSLNFGCQFGCPFRGLVISYSSCHWLEILISDILSQKKLLNSHYINLLWN